jgi:hypothetical protein
MSTKKRGNFWKDVNRVIKEADVLLLLLDARYVDGSRNAEIEDKVRSVKKPLIYVITKSDLADKKNVEAFKKTLKPCVFVSVRERSGRTRLKERIIIEGERVYGNKERINIGVLGYPNVGKSSLINYMKGHHSAHTSSLSGYTKTTQTVKSDNRLYFIDTPGVIPYHEKDAVKHVAMSVIDFMKVRDPDIMVMEMMRKYPGRIEAHFGVSVNEDKEKAIAEIARKKNVLMRGGVPDVERICRSILKDIQNGKIRL